MQELNDSMYFPQKLKRNKEIIQGLGKKELMQVIMLTLVLQSVNVVLYILRQDIFTTAIYFLITAAVAYGLYAKLDESNTSFMDQMHFMLRRMQSPKRYRYFYLDEWRLREGGDSW